MNIQLALIEKGIPLTEKIGKAYLSKDPNYTALTLYHLEGKVLDILNAVSLMANKFRWRVETQGAILKELFGILGNDKPVGEFTFSKNTTNIKGWVVSHDNYIHTELWLLICNDYVYKTIKPLLENLGET